MSDRIGVGFIGTGFMGRAHAHALHSLGHVAPGLPATRLVAVAGRDPERTRRSAEQWGFARSSTDWRDVVEDPDVAVVANLAATDAHAEPVLRAVELGKTVLCEKPLAATTAEAQRMADAVAGAGTVAVCGYNYRFVPALRLARELVRSGALGAVRAFRGCYLQDWANPPEHRQGWRFAGTAAGSTAGDLSHTLDLMRWLLDEEPDALSAVTSALDERGAGLQPHTGDGPDVCFNALLRLRSGATATVEGSRVATGWKGRQEVEVIGSAGSLWWNMEDLNRLHVFLPEADASPAGTAGFRDVLVTEAEHPFLELWWPSGHILGWEHTFAHQWLETLQAHQAGSTDGWPDLPTFADGLRAVALVEAVHSGAGTRSWVDTGA